VHVVAPMSYPVGILEIGMNSPEICMQKSSSGHRQTASITGVRTRWNCSQTLLLKGDPAVEIAQIARDEHVDLIVQSTRGHGMFYRFLLARWRRKCCTRALARFGPILSWTQRQRASSLSTALFARLT